MMKNLNSLRLLVTRPLPFAIPLCDAIKARGGEAIPFPTIAFAPLPQTPQVDNMATFDWLIFVSPYAVQAYQNAYSLPPPPSCQCAAIGEGTAKALQTLLGITVSAYPQGDEWNSETLLELPQFQDVMRKKIAIIRGVGGREYLEKILGERGAIITPLILYRRVLPEVINISPYVDLLKTGKIDAVICTSFEGVSNLKKLFGAHGAFPDLQKIPLIIVSERIKILAHDLGFQTIWVARNASTEAILNTINQEIRRNDR